MATNPDRLTFAEFLAWEARQEARYEYADGEIVAMSGGTGDHTRIADNVRSPLNARFVGGPCYAYGPDRKVQTGRGARYPDATVTCSDGDHGTSLLIASPVVILEVISESSVYLDTVRKLNEYLAMPTLQQYLLVDSRARWAIAYLRHGDRWETDLCENERIAIPTFGLALTFDEVYVGTSLARPPRGVRADASRQGGDSEAGG